MSEAQIAFDDDSAGADDITEVEQSAAQEATEETQAEEKSEQKAEEGSEEKAEDTTRRAPEFSPEQQEYINNVIISKQTAKRYEIERQLQEREQELERIRSQTPTQSQESRPTIPPMPDAWDENYDKKVAERDDAIRAAAAYDARQQAEQEMEQQRAQQQALETQQQLQKTITDYTERAQGLGIDPADLQQAGNALSAFDIQPDIVEMLLLDADGPAVTMHLAKNMHEANALTQMSPLQAALYIEREIRPRAVRNIKRRQSAPDPIETPEGKGSPEKQRGPKGAKYE